MSEHGEENEEMSETNWRRGPWRPVPQYDEVWADGTVVAEIRSGEPEQTTATVHLIAAAPTLYAALTKAEAALAVKASLRGAEQARVERALEEARAALAMARGELFLPEAEERQRKGTERSGDGK